MKKVPWFLLGLALVMLAAAPLAAEEGKAKAKPAADALKGEYAIMTAELKLTDQQQADLKAKVQAKAEALVAWEKANGEKLKAAQEAAKKAKEGGDKDAAKKAADELKTVEADRTKITADADAAIAAILSAEQKTAWECFKAYRAAMGRYRRVNPTDEQSAKIRVACAAACKEAAAVTGDEKVARKAKSEIEAKLRQTIENTILTAEQREALAKKPEPKPAAEKKPAPAK